VKRQPPGLADPKLDESAARGDRVAVFTATG